MEETTSKDFLLKSFLIQIQTVDWTINAISQAKNFTEFRVQKSKSVNTFNLFGFVSLSRLTREKTDAFLEKLN